MGALGRAGRAALDASFDDRPVSDLAQVWVEEELRGLEAVGMVVQENADNASQDGGYGLLGHRTVMAETMTASVDEVALATGLPEGQIATRLELALDPDQRSTPLLVAVDSGSVSLERATRIHQATCDLDPETARAVGARLLAPCRDGSVRSHRSFTRELRRQVAVHTADPAMARASALRERCAYGWLEPDGTGRLTVTGEGARITAALDRVDGLARTLRAQGDARTLAQLRSDVTLDLVLYGWADPARLPQGASDSAATTFLGQSPSARVNLVVALTTVIGLDNQPGEIPGHGFVPATVARGIALAGGSVWRRLVTDPLDGTALELSTGRYRPTRAMAEQVAALDAMCQAPGCTVPADRCDVDHEVPWPAGGHLGPEPAGSAPAPPQPQDAGHMED